MDSRNHSHRDSHYIHNHHSHNLSHGSQQYQQPFKRNYKLLIDPAIVKGANKLYRYEGIVEGDPTYPNVTARDPRKQRIWIRPDTLDLPVPRFKIDENYVGEPPPLEVTIFNINDNIDEQFLHNEIVNKHQCGVLESLHIYTHTFSRKHLGIARLIFEETESAGMCVKKLDNVALMGRVLHVFLDPFGNKCKERVQEITDHLEEEAKKEEEAKEARKRPPVAPKASHSLTDDHPKEEILPNCNQKVDQENDLNNISFESEKPHGSPLSSSTSAYYREHHKPHQVYQGGGVPVPPSGPPMQGQHFQQYDQFSHPPSLPPQSHHPHEPMPLNHRVPPHYPPYSSFQNYRPGYSHPIMPPNHQWGNSSSNISNASPVPSQTHPLSHNLVQHSPVAPIQTPQEQLPKEHPWEARYREYERSSHTNNESSRDRESEDAKPIIDHDAAQMPNLPHETSQSDDGDAQQSGGLDLETRIAMLLQNKDNNIAAPFLNLAEGSDEEQDQKDAALDIKKQLEGDDVKSDPEVKGISSRSLSGSSLSNHSSDSGPQTSDKMSNEFKDEFEEPLSVAPSPFLSEEQYLLCHGKGLELKREAQRIEKEELKERLKKLKKQRNSKRYRSKKEEVISEAITAEDKNDDSEHIINGLIDDDKMSLSSLSATEDPILHQEVPVNDFNVTQRTEYSSHYMGSENVPPYMPQQGYPPQPGNSYPWQPQPYLHNGPASSGYPSYNSACMSFPPNSGQPGSSTSTGHIPLYQSWHGYPFSSMDPEASGHRRGEYHDPTINSVLDTVIDELKKILKRDFNRRMIEATAFKTFEIWCEEQERKFKAQKEARDNKSESQSTPTSLPRPEKISCISSLFEMKDGFGLDPIGSYGLGFRAAMPKMPSFRKIRKIKPPTPPRLDEDSIGFQSDDDSKQSNSLHPAADQESSESEDEAVTSPVKKKVTTSQSSSSESESSSSEEVDVDSVSSDAESEASGFSSSSFVENKTEVHEDPEDSKQLVDLQKLEEELDSEVKGIVLGAIMKTPERESRTPTPIPLESSHEDDDWEDVPLARDEPSTEMDTDKAVVDASKKTFTSLEDQGFDLSTPKSKDATPSKAMVQPPSKKKSLRKTSTASETDTADEAEISLPDTPLKNAQQNGGTKENDSRFSEKNEEKSHSPILMDHSYSLPWGARESSSDQIPPALLKEPPKTSGLDHDYTTARTPPKEANKEAAKLSSLIPSGKENSRPKLKKLRENKFEPPRKKMVKKRYQDIIFRPRNQVDEYHALYSFLLKGIDQEDIELLKRSYERMLADDAQSYWLNDTHWVDHPPTDVPSQPKKKRKPDDLPLHKSGSARTEGIYKVDSKQKQKHKFTFHEELAAQVTEEPQQQSLAVLESSKAKPTQMSVSREVRSFQRRLLAAFGNETDSDLLKFNQLKFRKKLLKFGKSRIHDWGLFAMEAIAADEMVIEYVGQSVRPIIADLREVHYEKMGIGSSYLFRIDMENIIDATKCGNLARFINHSCNPNCYARIISVENRKKIVIYSKQQIAHGEEITYDYKFPIEEEKIVCLCGGSSCKGTLN